MRALAAKLFARSSPLPVPRPPANRSPRQVAAGAYVSRDRDSALKTMIYLAASRYNPDAEIGVSLGGALRSENSRAHSMLRKISLTAVSGGGTRGQLATGRVCWGSQGVAVGLRAHSKVSLTAVSGGTARGG